MKCAVKIEKYHETTGFTNREELLTAYKDVCFGDSMKRGNIDRFGESLWGFARSKVDYFDNIAEQYKSFLSDGRYCSDGLTDHSRKFLIYTLSLFANELQEKASAVHQEELLAFSGEVRNVVAATGAGKVFAGREAYFNKGLELKDLKSVFQAWKSMNSPFRGNLAVIDGILEEISSKVPPTAQNAFRFLYYTVIYLIQHFEDPGPTVLAHLYVQFIERLERELRFASEHMGFTPKQITVTLIKLATDLIARYSSVGNTSEDPDGSNGTPPLTSPDSAPPITAAGGSRASASATSDGENYVTGFVGSGETSAVDSNVVYASAAETQNATMMDYSGINADGFIMGSEIAAGYSALLMPNFMPTSAPIR